MLGVLSDTTLEELQRLTGCQFVRDIDNGTIFMGASIEELCHLAIIKLDNIQKYLKYTVRCSYRDKKYANCSKNPKNRPVLHVIYNENLTKVRYQIKKSIDLGINKDVGAKQQKYFETTLLDNLQLCPGNHYYNLWEATTIRLASFILSKGERYEPLKFPKYIAATPLSEAHEGSKAFGTDFTFCDKEPKENPMRHFTAAEEAKDGDPMEGSTAETPEPVNRMHTQLEDPSLQSPSPGTKKQNIQLMLSAAPVGK